MEYLYEYDADKQSYRYYKRKTAPFTSPHFHSAYEIVLVTKGTMYATINDDAYEISAGQGCFIDRFRPHAYSHKDPSAEVCVFVGDGAYFAETLALLGGVPPVKFCFEDIALLAPALSFYNAQTQENIKDAAFKSAVVLLLSAIAAKNSFQIVVSDVFSNVICAVLEYVETAYAENLSLKSIAEKFGYSPQHFSRLWHKYLQPSLSDYINTVRVSRAARQISAGSPVTEAAFSCGFQSLETFYRAYKKTYGVSPTRRVSAT